MVLAVAGVVLCLGMSAGAWYGRHAANTGIAQAIPVVDEAITTQTAALTRLDATLSTANDKISSARTRVSAVVDESAESVRAVVDTVSGTVDTILAPVRSFRTSMAALRGSMMLFSTFFNGLPSFLNLPEIPTQGLEELEARARAIDEQVAGVEQAISSTEQSLADARAQANATLDTLQSGISTVSEAATSVNTLLLNFQRGLPALQARVNTTFTWLALLVTLAALCGTALFVNLFYNAWTQWQMGGLDWLRSRTTTTTTETRTEMVDGGERTITTVTVTESKVNQRVEEPAT